MRISDAHDIVNLVTSGKIGNLDSYLGHLTGNVGVLENIFWHKEPRVQGATAGTPIGGQWVTLWEYEGAPLSHGAVPGAFANPTNATAGSMQQTDPVTVDKRFLTSFASCSQVGMLCIYDRLMHMGGLSGTSTGAQNLNGGSDATITRYTDGVGNQLWLEIYSTLGGTATTVTAAYKDGSGVSKTTQPVVIGGSLRAQSQRMIKMSLAAGGNTVLSASSITLLATTGGAGSIGVVIAHPLINIPIVTAQNGMIMGYLNGPMPVVKAGACLAMAYLPATVTALNVDMGFTFTEAA